jgi:adenylylsulfate kinase-like enzyme
MYKKARAGQIPDFTGVSAAFEEPTGADIVVDTERLDVEECVRRILEGIGAHKVKKYQHCLAGNR